MTASELYSKSVRVWLPDAEEVWKSAELIKDYAPGDTTLSLQLDNGMVVEYKIDPQSNNLPPLRNPSFLEGADDLTVLSYLHEPAVLHNLKVRFVESNLIYTYCGIVLVAINPYKWLPIYEADKINDYHGQDMENMEPHIFAVAEEAYKQMARNERNQSIIVSGDSGAGKTITAKYTLRYFATVSCTSGETSIEERVLATSPIMEAFGNAKTIRNDNSSRFGKYIEILFDKKHCIVGANMRTYLLEKCRVVFQARGERNYHIFHQLCASSHLPEFKAFKLGHADEFLYTNQGQSSVIEGVDDAKEMCATRKAFSLLGISENDQMASYQILSAILHLSNVEVTYQSDDQSTVLPHNNHLKVFCELMDVPCEEMAHWLCHIKLKTAMDTLVKSVCKKNAVSGRDALAKHIYARLFRWIVGCINGALRPAVKPHSFIGVLDIYGFETFNVNSFEQFCINYANEKLQQQFILQVFKLNQEEYMKEEISWITVDFYNNQPCIDLIEAKMGVLDLLDEECKMPKGSIESWTQKMYNTLLIQSAHFDKPRLSNRAFIIHHFGDKVEYTCEGFLEKNKDRVNEEQINVLKNSKFDLLLKLLDDDEEAPGSTCSRGRGRAGPSRMHSKKTVGSQFRQSLRLLMDTLNATTPHYVRCINPNDQKASFTFDPVKVMQQLRACGILETIRISAAGFPSRWTYQEFFSRFQVLMKRNEVLPGREQSCKNLIVKLVKDQDKFQFGKTKIFLRAGLVAYLEKLRSDKLHVACVHIQKMVRCWLTRKKYMRLRESAVTIQKHVRGYQARCYITFLRRTRAAVIIQKNTRTLATKRRYQQQRSAAVTIQCFWRGFHAKTQHYMMKFEQKAVIIQKWVRGWLTRQHYRCTLAAVILLQCCVRRMRAKKELKKQKIETRSVEHLWKFQVDMKNQIMQKIKEQHEKNRELSERLLVVEKTLSMDKEKYKSVIRSQQEAEAEEPPFLPKQLSLLQCELENSQREKNDLEQQMKIYKEETQQVIEELNMMNSLLSKEKDELNKVIQEQVQQMSANTGYNKQMEEDLSEQRSCYQSLEKQDSDLKGERRLRMDSLLGESVKSHFEMAAVQENARCTDNNTLNEDGGVWLVYKGLKETNRLLQCQILEQERVHNEKYSMLLEEMNKLRNEKEEQKNLMPQSLVLSEDACTEASLKHEITRLTSENLKLREQQEEQDKTIRSLIKQLEIYVKKIEESEASAQQNNSSSMAERAVNITCKENEFQGMLEYREGDKSRLIKTLITDLNPDEAAVNFIPGLPAYIIFMCVRYADSTNDNQRVIKLLHSTICSIRRVVQRRGQSFEVLSFWLTNTCRLMHCLKQYSGDEAVSKHNTATQNQQCLTNFELSEYQQLLTDLVLRIYHQLVTYMQGTLKPLIISTMMNTYSIQTALGHTPTGQRKQSFPQDSVTFEVLLQHLDHFYNTMSQHGMDSDLIQQVAVQLYYIICACTVNHLLMQKDMCSWSTGLHIRYNMWLLQEWLIEKELTDCGAKETLKPLEQVAQLLQVNKETEADAAHICHLCSALTPAQIVKALTLYTPVSEFEQRVLPTFIATVKDILKDRVESSTLLMDCKKIFSINIVFTPSSVALETIRIPESLNLHFLTRI